jgi:hypothetical protein
VGVGDEAVVTATGDVVGVEGDARPHDAVTGGGDVGGVVGGFHTIVLLVRGGGSQSSIGNLLPHQRRFQ